MNVMARAWEIARESASYWGGKASDYISGAVQTAWDEKKGKAVRDEFKANWNRTYNAFMNYIVDRYNYWYDNGNRHGKGAKAVYSAYAKMVDILERFRQRNKDYELVLLKNQNQLMDIITDVEDTLLYHYTTLSGISSITQKLYNMLFGRPNFNKTTKGNRKGNASANEELEFYNSLIDTDYELMESLEDLTL